MATKLNPSLEDVVNATRALVDVFEAGPLNSEQVAAIRDVRRALHESEQSAAAPERDTAHDEDGTVVTLPQHTDEDGNVAHFG